MALPRPVPPPVMRMRFERRRSVRNIGLYELVLSQLSMYFKILGEPSTPESWQCVIESIATVSEEPEPNALISTGANTIYSQLCRFESQGLPPSGRKQTK